MTNQSTMDKLIEMRLTAMSDAFRNQQNDIHMKELSIEDCLAMLVDIEYSSRKNNHLKRLIKIAEFDQPEAYVMDIDYTSGSRLNRDLIKRLSTCEYISEHRNLFITGATGSGNTYSACAFVIEACKQYYTVKFVRLPDLLLDFEIARSEGTYRKVLSKYTNPVVLILDEWLLLKPTVNERKDIFELLSKRRKKSSTIFCAQYKSEGWYEQLGCSDEPLADAILDRIVHNSYIINIEPIDPSKDKSIREVYGMDKTIADNKICGGSRGSGQVAHTTPELRLCRTRIFI
ncbi:ATP-binding protein [Anaerocolumna jejuensis]|uniref:ATP-binding protein n=1 Tax=Anaerocolumna jejuensis TaxID=259063 RepID=UPI003F7C467E